MNVRLGRLRQDFDRFMVKPKPKNSSRFAGSFGPPRHLVVHMPNQKCHRRARSMRAPPEITGIVSSSKCQAAKQCPAIGIRSHGKSDNWNFLPVQIIMS
jgi:hypothetical protein